MTEAALPSRFLTLARERYTDPSTMATYLASFACPCERMEMARRALKIADAPAGRFGLDPANTAPVALFLGRFVADLSPEVQRINDFVADYMTEHGVTFKEAFIAMGGRFGEVGYAFIRRP